MFAAGEYYQEDGGRNFSLGFIWMQISFIFGGPSRTAAVPDRIYLFA